MQAASTASFRLAIAQSCLSTVESTLHDVIDYAANSIRTVNSRGAVPQHLDALYAKRRELVDVYRLRKSGSHRIDCHPASVDQNEGCRGAHIAKVEIGVITAGARGAEARFVFREIHNRRQRGEQLHWQPGIADLHRALVYDRNRRNCFHIGAADMRSRYHQSIELVDCLRGGFGCGLGSLCGAQGKQRSNRCTNG